MLIYYVIGLLVYFGALSMLTRKSKFQPRYLKGGVIAMLLWPIVYLIVSKSIIDESVLRGPISGGIDPRDILAEQRQTVLIIIIIAGALLFIGLPLLLKWKASRQKK